MKLMMLEDKSRHFNLAFNPQDLYYGTEGIKIIIMIHFFYFNITGTPVALW